MEGVRFGVIEGEVANEASYAITKTLTPSPVIKQIFEANIRTPESRDIVAIKVLGPHKDLMLRTALLTCIVLIETRSRYCLLYL